MVIDLDKEGFRTLDLIADLMDEMDVLLAILLQAEAIDGSTMNYRLQMYGYRTDERSARVLAF